MPIIPGGPPEPRPTATGAPRSGPLFPWAPPATREPADLAGWITRPLAAIFWGTLLLALDPTVWWWRSTTTWSGTERSGFSLDLLPDVIGYPVVIWAVLRIAARMHTDLWAMVLRLVALLLVVGLVVAVFDHWRLDRDEPEAWRRVLEIAEIVAAMISLLGLVALTSDAGRDRARSWTTTLLLVAVLWFLPVALEHGTQFAVLAGWLVAGPNLAVRLTGVELRSLALPAAGLVVAALLLLVVSLIPLIHFRISMRRTVSPDRDRSGPAVPAWMSGDVTEPPPHPAGAGPRIGPPSPAAAGPLNRGP